MSRQNGSLSDYQAFIFDLDGTLYELDGDSFSDSSLGQAVQQNKRELLASRGYDLDSVLSELRKKYGEDTSIALKDEFGISKDEYFGEVWGDINAEECIAYYPDDLAARIENLEVDTAILTNAPTPWAETAIDELEIREAFDEIRYGDENPKPNQEAFTQVTDALGIEPSQAFMVGDQPTDIDPANDLGMITVAIGRESVPENADRRFPDVNRFLEAV